MIAVRRRTIVLCDELIGSALRQAHDGGVLAVSIVQVVLALNFRAVTLDLDHDDAAAAALMPVGSVPDAAGLEHAVAKVIDVQNRRTTPGLRRVAGIHIPDATKPSPLPLPWRSGRGDA